MARSIKRLSPRRVATETKRGRYADGGGLYLQVSKFGTKSWIFRFTLDGGARQMGLGPIYTISLAEAREEAEKCRKLLRDGVDPIDARKIERSRNKIESAKALTFRACAEAYINSHSAGWRNAKHAAQWRSTLKAYVYSVFGDLPVSAVNTGLVMKVLEPIWTNKTETASRVRGRIEAVLDWATAREYRQGENPARWKGHLERLLPARTRVHKVKHHAALPYEEISTFMTELREGKSVAARGLEFQILTAARPGEAMGARWDEFDLSENVWSVPADRMKSGKVHRVPLSPDAFAVLETMMEARSSAFVFPGGRTGQTLSNMAFLQLLNRMGRGDLTAHGFRSTFRDWAAERTAYPAEVAEMALGHAVSNRVEAAYRRGDLFQKRHRLMEDWATFCNTGPKVVKFPARNVANLRPQ